MAITNDKTTIEDLETLDRVFWWLKDNGYGYWIVLRGWDADKLISVNFTGSPELKAPLREILISLINNQ